MTLFLLQNIGWLACGIGVIVVIILLSKLPSEKQTYMEDAVSRILAMNPELSDEEIIRRAESAWSNKQRREKRESMIKGKIRPQP